jgi:integrase
VRAYERGASDWKKPADRIKAKERDNTMFEDYAERWFAGHRTKTGAELRGTSKRKVRVDLDHLLPVFGDMRMTDIKPGDIGDFLDRNDLEGEYATFNAYKTLKQVMRAATLPGPDGEPPLIDASPCIRALPTPESKQSEIDPPSPEELKRIYELMPERTRISVYISAAAGGLRVSEVCALQRRDIDIKHRILHVRHSVNRGETDRGELRLGDTKTKNSVRDVTIPAALIPLLEQHLKGYVGPRQTDMLLPAPKSAMISRQTLYAQFKRAAKAAGRPDLHFHTLRATATTEAILAGATLAETMHLAGHKDSKTAVERYQRVLGEHERQVADTLGEMLILPDRTPEVIRDEIKQVEAQIKELQSKLTSLHEELAEDED